MILSDDAVAVVVAEVTAIYAADHRNRNASPQHEGLAALQQIQTRIVPNDQGHGLAMAQG